MGQTTQKLVVITVAVGVTITIFLGLSVWVSKFFDPPSDDSTLDILRVGREVAIICDFEFTGKIVDEIGTPISNAQIHILDGDRMISSPVNEQGQFTLTNDPGLCGQAEKRLPLNVSAPGYKPSVFLLDLKQKEEQFTLYAKDF